MARGGVISDEGIEARGEARWLRQRLAAEAAEREELLDVLSHELRTPVTVISGFHRLLLSGELGPLTPEQRRSLEEASRSCRWLDSFIEGLTEPPADPACDAERTSVSLEQVVPDVAGRLRPLFADGDVRFECDIAPGAVRVSFVPGEMVQVLTNLIVNAVRHAPAGSVVRVESRRHDDRFVAVAVTDAGAGVAAADRERIFLPYVRGPVRANEPEGSRGLGLAIARRIVEAHGGTLRYVPDDRGGSRFVFTAPAAEDSE